VLIMHTACTCFVAHWHILSLKHFSPVNLLLWRSRDS
jgi:hypothetical protein